VKRERIGEKPSQCLADRCEQCTSSGEDEQLRFAFSSFGRKDVFPDVHSTTRFREKSGAL